MNDLPLVLFEMEHEGTAKRLRAFRNVRDHLRAHDRPPDTAFDRRVYLGATEWPSSAEVVELCSRVALELACVMEELEGGRPEAADAVVKREATHNRIGVAASPSGPEPAGIEQSSSDGSMFPVSDPSGIERA